MNRNKKVRSYTNSRNKKTHIHSKLKTALRNKNIYLSSHFIFRQNQYNFKNYFHCYNALYNFESLINYLLKQFKNDVRHLIAQ